MDDLSHSFRTQLTNCVGESCILTESGDLEPYLKEERGIFSSECSIVVCPIDTKQVSNVVKLCSQHNVTIVPFGGNTGLVGGAVASGGIILSLEKLDKVLDVDTLNNTMLVDAGCILSNIQHAAKEANRLFPLSLGAEGSCQIGGNLSTNAGGVSVLQYGNTRDLVLGIEAVLPDGSIFEDLNSLRKNNTGYDIKQLLIGAEGTLGIITKAVLKLYPQPQTTITTFVALSDLDRILELFDLTRENCGEKLTAFELIPHLALELVVKHIPGTRDPLQEQYSQYALLEFSSSTIINNLKDEVQVLLERALNKGIIIDAVLAESQAQSAHLWKLREEIPAAQSKEGGSIKHDVSIPISRTAEFINLATQKVETRMPGIRVCAFGHIGDGNIHFNLTQPIHIEKGVFLAEMQELNRIVHDIVISMNGSISAEHGIGLSKRDEFYRYSPSVKIEVMKQIKQTLDPKNIMNPNKILL